MRTPLQTDALDQIGQEQEQKSEDELAQEKKILKFLKALRDSARSNTKKYMQGFHDAWGYTIGEKRFPAPMNQAAKQMEKNVARTCWNKAFATMDHKVSVITDAEPRILMKTLQTIPEMARKEMEAVLESELDRLAWNDDALAVAWDGEVGGVGLTEFYVKHDPLTGEAEICTHQSDPSLVYVNEGATKLQKKYGCLYMVAEKTLPLATIREMWPDEGYRIKPRKVKPYGVGEDGEFYQEHTDDQIVEELPGNEFVVTKEGYVVAREATIYVATIASDELEKIWEEGTNNEAAEGSMCPDCGSLFIDPENPAACPSCGAEGSVPVDIPAGQNAKQLFERKKYPFGRVIIGSPEQGVLLYDGPDENQLERIFPYALYQCYKPGKSNNERTIYGPGDHHLTKSLSKGLDKLMGLIQDHLNYNAHPILEHPTEAEAYQTIGNAPGSRAPVDSEYCGMARFLSGSAFDYQGFNVALQSFDRAFKETTSVDEIAVGGSPAPESGEAQKMRQMARGKRISGTLKRMNDYRTDYASIVWELMRKHYTTPRTFITRGPQNQLQAITLTISELPYDVIVEVTADPDKVETDRLMGQNLAQFIMSGAIFNPALLPFMDIILSGFGIEPAKAEQVQQLLQGVMEQQAEQAAAQQQMMGVLGLGAGGDAGAPAPPGQSSAPAPQMEGAMQ